MTIFPNGKINIGLWVCSKREDGFHNIESVLYPVGVRDACEFVMQENGADSDEFTSTGKDAACSMNDNLVMKAINLIREKYNIPALKVHLHKAIPLGAGLGGGSSDASFILIYLNRYFRLGLCNNELAKMSAQLGSDCPFFIQNIPAYATGRGEILKKVPRVLSGYNLLIVNPEIHINTALAYASISPKPRESSLLDAFRLNIEKWHDNLNNDFESYVFESFPEIESIKNEMYRQGAIYSSMSGSGSSVYGIFRDKPPLNLFNEYWTWAGPA
jgi:4-diphosphocytidyl-2-C-methyl-D-erythritol kinase